MNLQLVALTAGLAICAHEGVRAQSPGQPEKVSLSVRGLHYADEQDDARRITVRGLATQFVAPVADAWSIELGHVVDVISGASPAFYSNAASAARIEDRRTAVDARLGFHADRHQLWYRASDSRETDYVAKGHALGLTTASSDRNTTFDMAYSFSSDRIDPVNGVVANARKHTREWLLGVTQVVNPTNIVQFQLTHVDASGYLSDPYKLFDRRPDHKRARAIALRWNRLDINSNWTTRVGLRLTSDDQQLRSTTLQFDASRPFGDGWVITPSLRFYSQSSAAYYSAPDPRRPDLPHFPRDFNPDRSFVSFDQRLAPFGALTIGIKLARQITSNLIFDVKWERYRQRSQWTTYGRQTPLSDLGANYLQIGIQWQFDR